jgi:DNA-binding IclR family transcriptional regulator
LKPSFTATIVRTHGEGFVLLRARQAAATAVVARAGSRDGGSSVRVIERTMRILKCLARHHDALTLTEISQQSDLHKATVLRFLKTLEHGGFVASGARGKGWRLGPAFLDIRMQALGRHDVREIARPFMEEASRLAGETVQLAILADNGVVYIEKIEPPDQALRINTQIGTRRPIHCTALGKVLAAGRERREVEQIVQATGLQRFTPRTITSLSAFLEALAQVRRAGYAIDDREFNELVACVAAPVRDEAGRTVAGLSISTFGIAVDSARFRELVDRAVATAEKISAALGWRAE